MLHMTVVFQEEVDVIKVEPDIDTETCSISSFTENELFDDMKQDDPQVKTFPVKKKAHKPVSWKILI